MVKENMASAVRKNYQSIFFNTADKYIMNRKIMSFVPKKKSDSLSIRI